MLTIEYFFWDPSICPRVMEFTVLSIHNIFKLLCKYYISWCSGSWWKDFQDSHPIFTVHNFLLLEGYSLYTKGLEFLFYKDNMHQIWLNMAQRFWNRIKKCQKFIDIRMNGETDRQTNRRRNDEQHVVRKAHLRYKWAKNLSVSIFALHKRIGQVGEKCMYNKFITMSYWLQNTILLVLASIIYKQVWVCLYVEHIETQQNKCQKELWGHQISSTCLFYVLKRS